MRLREFRRAGHAPSLVAALIHFDVSFMVWTVLGALGVYIAEDLGLTASQKGLLVAVPLLSAAVARIVMGILADLFGPRRVGSISMLLVLAPLLWGWLGATSFTDMLGVGLLLGVAGGSFAISLPLASRSFPPEYQGVAMGIAGAGNSGTVVCTLLAPRIAEQVGWHATLGIAAAPVLLAFLAFVLLAKEPPAQERAVSRTALASVLRERDTWKLCAIYSVTFGCFVGFTSFLPILLHDEHGLSKLEAATVTATGAALGSLLRPLGGLAADRFGGTAILSCVFGGVAVALLVLAQAPTLGLVVVGFPVAMAMLGMGNGASFQLVGLRFRAQIGTVTGLVGAAGGLGGFLLPTFLGALHSPAHGYALGLLAAATVVLGALGGIMFVRPRWRRSWAVLAEVRV